MRNREKIQNKSAMDSKDVVLIGMPTVGKSSMGVVLAKAMGYRFIDSDIVIQEKEGKMLNQLIKELGTDGFLDLENEINCTICEKRSVIATGGSAVYGAQAMEHFKETGTVVYLREKCEVIKERLLDPRGRGVTIREGQTIDDLFQERQSLYEKYADITVDVGGRVADDVITEIMSEVNKIDADT